MRVLDKDGDYCLSETEFENLAEKIINKLKLFNHIFCISKYYLIMDVS